MFPKSLAGTCFPHLLQGRHSWQHIQKASPVAPCEDKQLHTPQTCAKALPREEQTSKQSCQTPQSLNPCVKQPLQDTGKAAGQDKLYINLRKGDHTAPGAIPAPTQLSPLEMALQLTSSLTKLWLGPSFVELNQQHSSRWGPCTSKTTEGQQSLFKQKNWGYLDSSTKYYHKRLRKINRQSDFSVTGSIGQYRHTETGLSFYIYIGQFK